MTTNPAAYSDPYPSHKGSDRITQLCGACAGTGLYTGPTQISFYTETVGDVAAGCLRCHGTGTYSFLVSSARATARRRARSLDEQKAAVAKITTARDAFTAEHGDIAHELAEAHIALRAGDPLRATVAALLDEIETYTIVNLDIPTWRTRADTALAEVRVRAAAMRPVPTGLVEIEGTVAAVKVQESRYGATRKLLIEGDGWKVWGTRPSSLDDVDGLRGRRIALTATVSASGDDPTFGFYSRPRNARVID
jgi:hypothetical protein